MNIIRIATCLSISALLLAGCSKSQPGTESAASEWKEVKTSGIAISFPPDWKPVVVSATTGKDVETALGTDPRAKQMAAQAVQMSKSGIFKLFVYGPFNSGAELRSNCNVIVRTLPTKTTLDEVVRTNENQLKSLAVGGKLDLSYVNTPAGVVARLVGKYKTGLKGLNSTVYIAINGKSMVVVTFTADDQDQAGTLMIGDLCMKTFKFE